MTSRAMKKLKVLSQRFTRFILHSLLLFVICSILIVWALRWIDPQRSSFMWQARLSSGPIHHQWIPYQQIADPLKLAVIAAEDQQFPQHAGFDWQAIKQAVKHNNRGKSIRGGSTISQQVTKNLFLWPQRSFLRKGLEAWFTLLIEAFWPKQRILEVYLNIAQFGPRSYGAHAAASQLLKRKPAAITQQQAALLAAVLPNPNIYHVKKPSSYVLKRQRWIYRQMRNLGRQPLDSIENEKRSQ